MWHTTVYNSKFQSGRSEYNLYMKILCVRPWKILIILTVTKNRKSRLIRKLIMLRWWENYSFYRRLPPSKVVAATLFRGKICMGNWPIFTYTKSLHRDHHLECRFWSKVPTNGVDQKWKNMIVWTIYMFRILYSWIWLSSRVHSNQPQI